MKYAFLAIFAVAIIVMTYYIIESIRRPVNFQNTWAARKVAVHKQLEDIVELQKMYKILHEDTAYANNFDEMLSTFLKDSFSILKIEGDPYDTLKKADTIRIRFAAKDSMFSYLARIEYLKKDEFSKNKDDKAYVENKVKEYINKMSEVPFSENKSKNTPVQKFDIKSDKINLEGSRLAGNFKTPTFEVGTKVKIYMPEFDPKEFSMYNPDFDTSKLVKVGDLTKITTAGNW
jgi:hypothetical protein